MKLADLYTRWVADPLLAALREITPRRVIALFLFLLGVNLIAEPGASVVGAALAAGGNNLRLVGYAMCAGSGLALAFPGSNLFALFLAPYALYIVYAVDLALKGTLCVDSVFVYIALGMATLWHGAVPERLSGHLHRDDRGGD
jgi:hypothetical protein